MDRYAVRGNVPIEAAAHLTDDPSRLLNFKDLLANVELALDAIPEPASGGISHWSSWNGYSVREGRQDPGCRDCDGAFQRALRQERSFGNSLTELRDELS